MHWYIAGTLLIVVLLVLLVVVVVYDLRQKKHAILHNFPIVGHFRYLLESIGPELRQYIVTGNDEERPFSRDERSWIYASSKKQNNFFGFGTDNDLEQSPNYLIIKHAPFPLLTPPHLRGDDLHAIPCAKKLGQHRQRKHAFRPASVVNISAMSFGSLSGVAVEALNRGSELAGCLHNTGEGGVSHYHQCGGELIWQIGTGYFGCRSANNRFDEKLFLDVVQANPIKAIEIKLSQGAKPGKGGLLPKAKITSEIAAIRGIPMRVDCASPSGHREFHNVDQMLDFVERLAELSGLPVGIKSAVGEIQFWDELANQMSNEQRGVDYIAIDGGEGGTGAAPLTFCDHVALPFKMAMARVHDVFAKYNMQDRVVFVGAGKLGFPDQTLLAFALGCDMIAVGREAMLAIGCIQAQRCHSGHCPTGVATQSRWLMAGLDPTHKSARLANYIVTLRKEVLDLSRACGHPHPALVSPQNFEIIDECFRGRSLLDCFHVNPETTRINQEDEQEIRRIMGEGNGQ
ncbi:MAG: FMN-binding glutamate synthase family protein [Pirellulaceae bacterium]|jgi:glutamate synthase (ferredoxin)|nr:FMN-binding glutamate synthase family protein [Pirellulaceae bacterium]